MASEHCSTCGEEVRYGVRGNSPPRWLHREEKDHKPTFGRLFTEADKAEVERQIHLTRYLEDGTPYTTAEFDRKRMSKKKRDALDAEEADPEEEGHDELEPIEVHRTDMPHKGVLSVETPTGPREVPVPGGVRTIINLAEKIGWEVTRLTYARGPYLGASGKSLGVSDSVVLHVRGVTLDGRQLHGVGSWRDGKSDTAYQIENKTITKTGANDLKAWMKENPSG